jgi:small conductance mechanosensitive channel
MEEYMQRTTELFSSYGPRLITALLIFLIGKLIARWITHLLAQAMHRSKVDTTLIGFSKNLSYSLMLVIVVIAAINKLGVQTTSLVAIVGAAGLAVGLALQGSLSNFAAGVMIIILKPFRVGDFITAADTMGSVVEIGIFNTTLNHPDNRRTFVPNSKIIGDNISNFSAIEKRRIDLVFSISYTDNIKVAKDTLMALVEADERVLKDPAPVIAVSELGDSSVNIVCRPYVRPGDYWNVYFSLLEKGKIELERNGITIPFPQRDIHVFPEKSIKELI